MTKTTFTEKLADYMKFSTEERKKFSEENPNLKRQYDYKIRKYAKDALKNLTLIAAGYEGKRVQEIFDVDMMMFLLNAVVSKTYDVKTHQGTYYMALLSAIKAALGGASMAASNNHESITIEVKKIEVGQPSWQRIDLTDGNKERSLKHIEENRYHRL